MAEDELERSEIQAVLETRRELGTSYDAALVDGFAERIERAVEERSVEVRSRADWTRQQEAAAGKRQLALGIVSLGAGIPISAIALAVPEGLSSLVSLAIAWGGISAVNLAHAIQGRQR